MWTAKDTWLGPEQTLGGIGALYNLTMDPCEKYDMTFNGAVSYRLASSSPGKYSGQDNGWVMSLVYPPLIDFDKSIIKYPNIKRFPGGASNDLWPNRRTRRILCQRWIRTIHHTSAVRAASRARRMMVQRAVISGRPFQFGKNARRVAAWAHHCHLE